MTLQQQKDDFCRFLREPEPATPPKKLNPDRAQVYRDLVFNTIDGLLANNFPLLSALLTKNAWHTLIRAFIQQHRCQTPYFHQLPEEFIAFLADREPDPTDPVFLNALADYEYLEAQLFISPIDPESGTPVKAINADSHLHLSTTAVLRHYAFPVHTLSVENPPKAPSDSPHYLLLFQDAKLNVRYFECNLLSYCLLQSLQAKENRPLKTQVADLHAQLAPSQQQVFSVDALLTHAITLMEQLNALDAIRTH